MKYILKRILYGKGFVYKYLSGKNVKNLCIKTWIKKFIILPDWSDVLISLDRDNKANTIGLNSNSKKKYIHNKSWFDNASKREFNRKIRFTAKYKTMRWVTARHLERAVIDITKTLVCITRMLHKTFLRPGHVNYTRNNNNYGLTTLKKRPHLNL